MRNRVQRFKLRIRAALDDASANLQLFIGIIKTHHRQGDSRIAPRVLCFERAFPSADHEMLALAPDPDRHSLRRTVRHKRGKMRKVRAVDELFNFWR